MFSTRLMPVLWLAVAAPAAAAGLDVDVRDASGAALSDAIVLAEPAAGGATPPRGAPATRTVDQKNETFIPFVQLVRPGDRVLFRNSDVTRHHVYSFSPAGAFEFVLAPGESSQAIALDRPGIVAVGCNIHDHMIAYLYVTDAPYAAAAQDGRAHLEVPAGEYKVRVWHPQLRGKPPEQAVQAGHAASFALKLGPDPRQAPDRERSGY